MRGEIVVIILLFFLPFCYAFEVIETNHFSKNEVYFFVIEEYNHIDSKYLNNTDLYDNLKFKIEKNNSLGIQRLNNTEVYHNIIKIVNENPSLYIGNLTHYKNSNKLFFNSSEYNISRLIENNSELFIDYIKSIAEVLPNCSLRYDKVSN